MLVLVRRIRKGRDKSFVCFGLFIVKQQTKQRIPGNFLQLLRWGLKASAVLPRDTVPPSCFPASSLGPLQMTSPDVDEQQLYSEPVTDSAEETVPGEIKVSGACYAVMIRWLYICHRKYSKRTVKLTVVEYRRFTYSNRSKMLLMNFRGPHWVLTTLALLSVDSGIIIICYKPFTLPWMHLSTASFHLFSLPVCS